MIKVSPEQMIKNVGAYLHNLEVAKRSHVVTGLPKEKVGGKVYKNGMSILRIAVAHNYGATIQHPGGQPYIPHQNRGRAQFVSKSRQFGQYPETKPHTITLPRRDFMLLPFVVKRKEIDKAIQSQFKAVADHGVSAKVALGRVGAAAVNIQKGAFTTHGYGKWRRSKKAGQTLVDTGVLRNAITWMVRGAAA